MQKPQINEKITVVTDFSSLMKSYADYVPRQSTVSGTVIQSAPNDSVKSFRLLTNNTYFPISVVEMENVVAINGIENTIDSNSQLPIAATPKTFDVAGSSGKSYVVTFSNNRLSCNCAAGNFNRACKHVASIKQQLGI